MFLGHGIHYAYGDRNRYVNGKHTWNYGMYFGQGLHSISICPFLFIVVYSYGCGLGF